MVCFDRHRGILVKADEWVRGLQIHTTDLQNQKCQAHEFVLAG